MLIDNYSLISQLKKRKNSATSNRLDYSVTGSNPSILLTVTGTPTITWHWSDGTITEGGVNPEKALPTTDLQAQWVTIDPPEALTRIDRDGVALISMDGCGNFLNFNYLMFYPVGPMVHLDLSGCSAMRQWHLGQDTAWPPEDIDQMIIDQEAALPPGPLEGSFYCPTGRTAASAAARDAIVARRIGWSDL